MYVPTSVLALFSAILPTNLVTSASVGLYPNSLKKSLTSSFEDTCGSAHDSALAFASASEVLKVTNWSASASVGFANPAADSTALASSLVIDPALIWSLIICVASAIGLPVAFDSPAANLAASDPPNAVSKLPAVAPAVLAFITLACSGVSVTSTLVSASRSTVESPTVNIEYTRSLVKSFK